MATPMVVARRQQTTPTQAAGRVASPLRQTRIEPALQGGGAHGAFTWGVLVRLLADDAGAEDAT
jgi:NTE family protein